MRRVFRVWGVSIVAWGTVLTIAGVAIAAVVASSDPVLTISPKGVVEGKTIDSDEPFEMTVHLQGDASSSYDLAVEYAGDAIGTCQEDAATIETNPEGKGVWTCTFDTAVNEGADLLTGAVTFTATKDDQTAELTASLSIRPAEAEEEPVVDVDVEDEDVADEAPTEGVVNHGHCVSFWAHESKARGLEGSTRGHFISSIAQDPDAVAPKTAAGEDPGESCDFEDELIEALAAQEAADVTDASAPSKGGKKKTSTPEK